MIFKINRKEKMKRRIECLEAALRFPCEESLIQYETLVGRTRQYTSWICYKQQRLIRFIVSFLEDDIYFITVSRYRDENFISRHNISYLRSFGRWQLY